MPAGFGGRLRGKGPYPPKADTGPRRAAHPVHADPATTHQYLEADLATKEAALQRLTAPAQQVTRYRAKDKLLAFLEEL